MSEQTIFTAALERDPEQRGAFLDQACGGDAGLRERVEKLLRLHQQAGDFMEQPAAAVGQTIDQAPIERPGTQIGPYKLLQQIGEGGMGVVYMAEQTEPVKRRVALKIIKPGMDSRQVIARFEAERQALSLMDHPNIAKVLDAGTTESGRPYFVMELVKGQPITQYCDEHHLTPRQRLELLLPVCQAIQHAHQKGIIHRDIKPTNILVAEYDQKAVPKVIDFGVAKATSQALTEKTMFTGFGQIVGTLEYMSPEQAKVNQLDIDTRSDIYSLGVLLYELLTGSTPFDKHRLRSAAWDEMLRIIREEEPQRPSTRLSSADTLPSIAANRSMEPTRLGRTVRGELDWIVMTALEKDRNRRYETASSFAADLQRYLNDEPVQACPPSAIYRISKYTRRHKVGLAMGALVLFFLVLLGSGAGWTWRDHSARHAEAARQQADRQAKVAGQVELVFAEVDRLEAEQRWPEALAAARRAEACVAGGDADRLTAERVRQRLRELEFVERLEQIRIATAMLVEGKFDYAGAQREYAQAFREYGVDVETLTVEKSIDLLNARPALSISFAAALDDWVEARRLDSPMDRSGLKRLVAVTCGIDPDPLRDLLRSTSVQHVPGVQDQLRSLADTIDIQEQRPTTLVSLARVLERVGLSNAALRVLQEAQYVYPGDFWLNFELTSALSDRKDFAGAIRYAVAAVSIRPNSSAAHQNLGASLFNQTRLTNQEQLLRENNLNEAIRSSHRAIELDPKNPKPYNGLGLALYEQGKLEEAIRSFRKAIELDPKFASAYTSLGNALSPDKPDDAIRAYQKALEINPKYANAYAGLGAVLANQNKPDEAVTQFRMAISIAPDHASAHNMLGKTLVSQNKLDEALASYHRAIALDPTDARIHYGLGFALKTQGKDDEAIASYRKAIELDPQFFIAYIGLSNALSRQGKLDESIDCLRKAIELDPNQSPAHCNLGRDLWKQGKVEEAIACCEKAIQLDPNNARAHGVLGSIQCDSQRDYEKAAATFRKAIELDPKHAPTYGNLGNALYGQNKLADAIDAYRKATELDPEYTHARSGLVLALGRLCVELANPVDLKLRDPKRAVELGQEAVELDPRSDLAWQHLGWAHYRAGNWSASVETLEKSCELQPGGTGDSFQWIVLALAHGRLATQEELPAEERARHRMEARRWYEQADKVITGRWQVRPGDSMQQAVWDFHVEAKELLVPNDNK